MVAYLWRWINPCMLVQYVMVSIVYNRAFEYLTSVQRMGFVPIIMVTMLTKAYYWILHANLVAAAGQQ